MRQNIFKNYCRVVADFHLLKAKFFYNYGCSNSLKYTLRNVTISYEKINYSIFFKFIFFKLELPDIVSKY